MSGEQTITPSLTNDFKYRQYIHAIYQSYQASIRAWTLLAGLRTEYTTTGARQITDNSSTPSRYTGFVGVICGIGVSRLVEVFADFKAIVSIGSVVLAFGVSCAIGVFFGFYPARKAAALDPIEALRYE